MIEERRAYPDADVLLDVCRQYAAREEHTPRAKVYRVAKQLIENNWGNAEEMANGVCVFLIAWKCHPYRYGDYDFRDLEATLDRHRAVLNAYRKRDLSSLSDFDAAYVEELFDDLARSLADVPPAAENINPIAAGMALHILSPNFFPLWDGNVARYYVGDYETDGAKKYLEFCEIAKKALAVLHADANVLKYATDAGKPLLKLYDEYNYMKHTLGYGE